MRFPWTVLLLSTVSAQAQVSAINSPDGKPLSQRVVAYWIDAKYDAATKTLEATETLEYRNPSDHPTTTLPFHLYLNAFRPESTLTRESHRDGYDIAYEKGEQGSIEVTAISTVAGADLTPSMRYFAPDDGNQDDHTVMQVTLPKPLGPGEIIRLQLAFHDKFPLAIGRNGYKRDFIMGAQWFPKIGVMSHSAWNCHQFPRGTTEFFADFGTYNVNLTLPQALIVGASGIQTGEHSNGDGTKTLNFRGEDIHDFAWVASPHFQIADDTFENSLGTVRLRALVLPSHEDQASRYLSVLKQSMQKFDEWYGPYPYKQITLIDPEPGSAVGGMEYPTLITAGSNWWEPSWDYHGLEATVAHELGHQYWYGMVATNEFEEPWLDEGIDSYSQAKVMASLFGQNTSAYNALTFYASDARRQRVAYLRTPDQDPIVRLGWKFANEESFVSIVYNKTTTVLLTLEGILGEATVRQALRLYFTRYRFTHPTGTDFLKTLQQSAAGTSLQPFLAQAIYGTEILDYSVDSLTADGNQTTVVIRRKGDFVLPVHVEVGFADGSREQVTWDGKDRWARWSWEKPSPAIYAQVDRDDNILLDTNSFNNSYVPQADRTARVKLTNYWIFTQQTAVAVSIVPGMSNESPNLLVQGFRLVVRNWPLLVWAYALNLAFGLLAGVPLASGLAPYLDHSLAAQKISGTVDVTYVDELLGHLSESSFLPITVHTAGWLTLIQLLFFFVFFAGTVFVYVSAEPPRFSVLLRGGVNYFWRFVRGALAAGAVSGVVLGTLVALRFLLLFRARVVYVERKLFLYAAISGGVIFLAGLLMRLWCDLVEAYIVRNAMDGERRVRPALLQAARLLYRHFFRAAGSFLLITLLGFSALGLCLFLWRLLPAQQVWLAALLAQLGLFLFLAARFWQRGMEAALVMSLDPPTLAAEELDEEEEAPVIGHEVLVGMAEPTLRDLVNKLRDEPWAKPETLPVVEARPEEPKISLVERHTTKFPLGGTPPKDDKD